MILKLNFKNAEGFQKKIFVNETVYTTNRNTMDIEVYDFCFNLKIILSKAQSFSIIKYTDYKFPFHKNDSKGFFQFQKTVNYCEKSFDVKIHRDCNIDIKLVFCEKQNIFDNYDLFSDLIIQSSNNVKFNDKHIDSNMLNTILKKCLLLEKMFLLLKCIFIGLIVTLLCYESYIERESIRTIFQGDFIWIHISLFIIAYIIYIAYLVSKINKL